MGEPRKFQKGKRVYTKWDKQTKEVRVMSNGQQGQQVQINIELDEQTAQGVYSNMAFVSHTETEFVFDFVFVQPQQPKAKVRARIVSSPSHTKRFLSALNENLKNYEGKFGQIKTAGEPERKVGF